MDKTYQKLCIGYFSYYKGLNKNIWTGLIFSCIESIIVSLFYFLPIYFINELHFSLIYASGFITFYGFGTILGGFLGGLLSDIYSPPKVCIASLFCQALVFTIILFIKAPLFIIVALVMMGFCSYCFITSIHLYVLNICKCESDRLRAINILSVTSNLGLALSAICVGLLEPIGFRFIFFLGAITLLCLSIVACKVLKSETNEITNVAKKTRRIFVLKRVPGSTILALFCTFIVGLIIFQCNTTYSIYIKSLFPSYGLRSLSILYVLNSILVVFFQAQSAVLFKKDNEIVLMGVGVLLIGIGHYVLVFVTNFSLAIISCILYTAGELLFFSIAQLICYQSGKEEQKGYLLGLYRGIYAVSRLIAPILGSLMYTFRDGDVLWCFCGVFGILCFVICVYYQTYVNNTVRVHPQNKVPGYAQSQS